MRADEDALTAVVALARAFGRYGYRRITDLLQMAGWQVNAKRVQRIWRTAHPLDNGPEFVAKAVRRENGYIESFNGSCATSC